MDGRPCGGVRLHCFIRFSHPPRIHWQQAPLVVEATDGFAAYFENYDLSSSGNDWVTFIGDTGDDAATDLWCIPDVINGNTGVIWVGGLTDPTATLPYDCSVPSTTSNGFVLILDEIGQYQESLDPGLVPFRHRGEQPTADRARCVGPWQPEWIGSSWCASTIPSNQWGCVHRGAWKVPASMRCPSWAGMGMHFILYLRRMPNALMQNELVVWPNPGHGGVLNLSISLLEVGHANITVDLFDATGRLVLQHTRQGEGPGQNNFQLIPPKLSSGLYTLRVKCR